MAEIPWNKLTLIHPETKKQWKIEVHENKICTCLNNGKVKEKDEKYPAEKAIQAAMAQFRKGFIYESKC